MSEIKANKDILRGKVNERWIKSIKSMVKSLIQNEH